MTATPADLLALFKANAGKRAFSGQFVECGPLNPISAIAQSTGKTLAIAGFDMWHYNNSGPPNDISAAANAWIAAGGIVTINYSMPNPQTGGGENDTNIDFNALLTAGTAANTAFNTMLDQIAAILRKINGPVMNRWWHEHNYQWFWWGKATNTQFIKGWQYCHDRLTKYNGLTNLLWVNAYNAGPIDIGRIAFGYTDMAGVDAYTDNPAACASNIATLAATGLPTGICEFGSGSASAGNPTFALPTLIAAMKGPLSPAVYWLNWWDANGSNIGWGMANLQNVAAGLADPYVMNRGDFSLVAATQAAPAAPIVVSANDTVIQLGSTATLTSPDGTIWGLSAGGVVTKNGALDITSANVNQIALVNGVVWQESHGLWWGAMSGTSGWNAGPAAGTAVSPLPVAATTLATVQSELTSAQNAIAQVQTDLNKLKT